MMANEARNEKPEDSVLAHPKRKESDLTYSCYLCGPVPRTVSRFKFPNDERRAEWLRFCNVENIHRHAMLCSAHFKPEDLFRADDGRGWCRLRRHAIPTIKVHADRVHPKKQSSVMKRRCFLCGLMDAATTRFKFPTDERRQEWLQFCNVKDVNRHDMLCAGHFRPEDIKLAGCGTWRRLVDGAVPVNKFVGGKTCGNSRYCYLCGRVKSKAVLFQFPEDERRAAWLQFCNVADVPSGARLCKLHFKREEIKYRKLQTDAIPTWRINLKNKIYRVLPKKKEIVQTGDCFLCGPVLPTEIRFPFPNDERRAAWLRYCNVTDVPAGSMLCTTHFDREHLRRRGRWCKLREGAVPTRHANIPDETVRSDDVSMDADPLATSDEESANTIDGSQSARASCSIAITNVRSLVDSSCIRADDSSSVSQNKRHWSSTTMTASTARTSARSSSNVLDWETYSDDESNSELAPRYRSRNSSPVLQQEDVSSCTTTAALTEPTSACSSFDEFDWETYLQDTNSEASPFHCFKQFSEPPGNRFEKGMILEAHDPRNSTSICVARVIGKCGPRLLLRLEGADDKNDFWTLVDSSDIQAIGTAEMNGHMLQPPLGFRSHLGAFSQFLARVLRSSEKAPEDVFVREPPTPRGNYFKPGQKLEAVDMKNRHLICVATVEKVVKDEVLVSLDGSKRPVGYSFKYNSRNLFPVGWCKKSGHPLSTSVRRNSVKRRMSSVQRTLASSSNAVRSSSPLSSGRVTPIEMDKSNIVDECESLASETSASETGAKKSPQLPSDATKWSIEDVIAYISYCEPSLRVLADQFRKHLIDGKALLLLNAKMLIEHMPLQIGPALKIQNIIVNLKSRQVYRVDD